MARILSKHSMALDVEMTRLRIHHLTAYFNGGAGVAARRLHGWLDRFDLDSRLFVDDLSGHQQNPSGSVVSEWRETKWRINSAMYPFRRIWLKALKKIHLRGCKNFFSLPWQVQPTPAESSLLSCDILHLHWIARQIDTPSFFASWPTERPIVWTLHDMNPLTGGCHHSDGCDNYQRRCGSCPMLRSGKPTDFSRRIFEAKEAVFRRSKIHLVAPSLWMESIARKSSLAQHAESIRTIYNGIELDKFRRVDSASARRRFGLAEDALVIGYGAESLTNKRKGIDEYMAALRYVSEKKRVKGLVFGRGVSPALPGVEIVHLGVLKTEQELSAAYSAMDMFVSPTHAEILGQAILESQACETPVIAFEVGGVGESVAHGETGLLAPLFDQQQLNRHALWLSENPSLASQMGKLGRLRVQALFDACRNTELYRKLYQEIA